jgi:hypothetical protein
MSVADWIALAGGAASGIDRQQMEDDRKALEQKRMALQEMLAHVRADSAETVAGTRADATRYTADQRRASDVDRVANTRITSSMLENGRNRRFDASNSTRQRGQDMRDSTARYGIDTRSDQYWGGDLPFRYDALETTDATRQRGQNMTASTATRGQDLAHGDRQDSIDVARGNTRARNALGVLALKGKQKPNLFGTAAPAEDWASEFDRLYNEGAGPDDVVDNETPAAPLPSTPGNVTPPPAAAAPPVAAGAPKPTPFAPPPAAKPPQGLQPGARVTLRNGKKVTITKVNPDGTFEYQ